MSISAYPTDSYFDPNRPSWLPYWIDTLTESALKTGMYPGVDLQATYQSPNPPPAPPSPQVKDSLTSPTEWHRRMPAATRREWEMWKKDAIPPPPLKEKASMSTLLLIALTVGAISVVLLMKGN